jgi:hypothetical protein
VEDRRHVFVLLRQSGEKLLERVARQRITEVRTGGAALVQAMTAVLGYREMPLKNSKKRRARQPVKTS